MNGDPDTSEDHHHTTGNDQGDEEEGYAGLDINDMVHDFGEGVGVDMRDFGVGVDDQLGGIGGGEGVENGLGGMTGGYGRGYGGDERGGREW